MILAVISVAFFSGCTGAPPIPQTNNNNEVGFYTNTGKGIEISKIYPDSMSYTQLHGLKMGWYTPPYGNTISTTGFHDNVLRNGIGDNEVSVFYVGHSPSDIKQEEIYKIRIKYDSRKEGISEIVTPKGQGEPFVIIITNIEPVGYD